MALLIDVKHPDWMKDAELRAELLRYYPEADIRTGDQPGNPEEIEMLTVSTYLPREALQYPNLKLIQKTGAGVNNILADPELPKHVPIIRTTGEDLKIRMREYVTLHVLRLHRRLPEIEAAQEKREWLQLVNPPAYERSVGLRGLGDLGSDCARTLKGIGFDVAGWSRRP